MKITKFIEQDFHSRQNRKEDKTDESMTEEEMNASLELLRNKDLIKLILKHISILGYIGEDMNKLLLYLCATSRKLDKPISVLIRSQSSTGKSFLVKTICSLMPPEDVHHWTSATEQALYYMPEDGLKHKFIAIDEQKGVEELEYPIRSLQSEGRLSRAVPIKNPSTNSIETQQITKQGPVSYVDGSTNTTTNPENANRSFELYLDESREQTIKVQGQQRKAHTLEGWKFRQMHDAIKSLHQNAQRLLKPIKVIIPFIDLIDFPSDWIRTRRDHDRFLSLIVCVTFLHQHQREVKYFNPSSSPLPSEGEGQGEGGKGLPYIESTVRDYEIAYKLASVVIFNTFQELEKPVYDFFLQLQEMVNELSEKHKIKDEEVWFTRRHVRLFTKLPDYLVKRFMKQLSDLEYFNIKAGPQGSRFMYSLNVEMKTEKVLSGLTTPEELGNRLEGEKGAEK